MKSKKANTVISHKRSTASFRKSYALAVPALEAAMEPMERAEDERMFTIIMNAELEKV